jgi:hypothetical protein
MKRFSNLIAMLNTERIRSLSNPKEFDFSLNQRGVMQKTFSAKILSRTKEGLKLLGNGLICYSDVDFNDNSPEAELVRSGRWKSYEVGKLWAFINREMIPLAKINPAETKTLRGGFETENGEFIIDMEKI